MTTSSWPMGSLHAVQRRYLAEDLVRLRRADEQRRYAAPQRAAKIDPNPHQIEAVIFALARVREGGCILADEVGLGKTIETGLVIAQMLAEGASRVLLVAPKPLLGQWRQELFTLFDIEAREGRAAPGGFDGPGVFLVGREQAGSEKGRDALLASSRFQLCVIDEAHEVFAGLYKRYDKFGEPKNDAKEARTAGRLLEVLEAFETPVILLTATPIQNNLAELWGLVRYVDPLGTLLGDLPTFREVFCGTDDRQLARGQEDELRSRLKTVIQRTLRRQAQEFLEKPFVERQARLFEYEMSVEERALYDDVTKYLLEPGIIAFQGRHRQLLLIGFHRRMASSTRALAVSLQRVVDRLRRKLRGQGDDGADVASVLDDLEQSDVSYGYGRGEPEDEDEEGGDDLGPSFTPEAIQGELQRVEGFVRRAERLVGDDGKLRALLTALSFVTKQAREGKGAGKLVIFTESLVTQDHIRERLVESRLVREDEITLFRGTNDSPAARAALGRWRDEAASGEGPEPSSEMAMRLALVHEFKTRSRVFISTEAGAKGLNLQFCDALVNYDLPWNPQRIEQRIGRCHRYGQKNEVTVINFLAKDNEAQQLTFDILSQKLDLFGTVLDASDKVLHHGDASAGGVLASALGAELEAELRRIYERSRTVDEVTAELRSLRERVVDHRHRFEDTHARTAQLIEEHLDDDVKRVLRLRRQELPSALAELDRDVWSVVRAYLEARSMLYTIERTDAGEVLHVPPCTRLPGALADGVSAALGVVAGHTSLHLRHPLVLAAVADARAAVDSIPRLVIRLPAHAPPELEKLRGRRGRSRIVKLTFDGFERVERLLPVTVLEGYDEAVPAAISEALLRAEMRDAGAILDASSVEGALSGVISDDDLEDATEELLSAAQQEVDAAEQQRFERADFQAQRFLEDRLLVHRRRRDDRLRKLEEAQVRRDSAMGSEARTAAERRVLELDVEVTELEAAIERLERREDKTFQRFHDHIHQRRYRPPTVDLLFEMELVVE
ncbi:SNF2-related protein [Pendulispora albinea]|uniref:DEAD/DEAH box helicase n=1 Tax=Pendulispora albinea TaxID=2741071 RepID=A0ABZ2M6H0_9BACT